MAKRERMKRAEFFEKVGPLDAERLRGILWTLYWRGGRALQERIEEALAPPEERRRKAVEEVPEVGFLSLEVERFVALARSGAYIGGTRNVSRKERSLWRVTFRRLIKEASEVVLKGDLEQGRDLLESLLELANDARGIVMFHSEDPVEAMKLVFNETVELIWRATLDREGFDAFAARAAAHMLRWESQYGWTVTGFGATAERERTLTSVLSGMLRGADAWARFAHFYRAALDPFGSPPSSPTTGRRASRWAEKERQLRYLRGCEERARSLLSLHLTLVEYLEGGDDRDLLDGILAHPAFAGPYQAYAQARLAHLRGDVDRARRRTEEALRELPGWNELVDFAESIGAALPERALRLRESRSR